MVSLFNAFNSVCHWVGYSTSFSYDQFGYMGIPQRLQMVKNINYWTENQLQNLLSESEEEVIKQVLQSISLQQLAKIQWDDKRPFIEEQPKNHGLSKKNSFAYFDGLYKDKSQLNESQFMMWVQYASSDQLFVLLMSVNSVEQVNWLLKNIKEESKTDLKKIFKEWLMNPKQAYQNLNEQQGLPKSGTAQACQRFYFILVKMSQAQPFLFMDLAYEHIHLVPGFVLTLALPNLLNEQQAQLIEVYLQTASVENISTCLLYCLAKINEDMAVDVKKSLGFVQLFDQIVCRLDDLHLRSKEVRQKLDCDITYSVNGSFAFELLKYVHENPNSEYFKLYVNQITKHSEILLSLASAFKRFDSEEEYGRVMRKKIVGYIDQSLSISRALSVLTANLKKSNAEYIKYFIEALINEQEELMLACFWEDIHLKVSDFRRILWMEQTLAEVQCDGCYPIFNDLSPQLAEKIFTYCQNKVLTSE